MIQIIKNLKLVWLVLFFSKFVVVVPIKSKQEGDVASGILECLNKMAQTPQTIYTASSGPQQIRSIRSHFGSS